MEVVFDGDPGSRFLEEFILQEMGCDNMVLPYPPDPWEVEEFKDQTTLELVVNQARLWKAYFRSNRKDLLWIPLLHGEHLGTQYTVWAMDKLILKGVGIDDAPYDLELKQPICHPMSKIHCSQSCPFQYGKAWWHAGCEKYNVKELKFAPYETEPDSPISYPTRCEQCVKDCP